MAPTGEATSMGTYKISKLYTVVKFANGTVELVPSKWIIGGKLCLWPAKKQNSKIADMIRDRAEPEDDWELHPCVCMASFSNYRRGKKNAREAEYTSHLESETSDEDTTAEVDLPAKRRMQLPSPPHTIDNTVCSSGRASLSPPPLGSMCITEATQSPGPCFSPEASDAVSRSSQAGRDDPDGNLTAYQKKLLKLVLDIKAALRDLSQRVAALEGTAAPVYSCDVLEQILQEPLSSLTDWEILEEKLQDNATRHNLVDRLAVLGGSSLNDVVRIIMETCTRKSVQQQLTVEGRNGKRPFKGTRLFSCVLAAVHKRMGVLKVGVTDKEICARISRYLASAGDREGGRKERTKK
ncbi:uncharacterized protein LOC135374575 [Ornithodoros turicata]|uniref:uncharacterized protein LOC135374575 n=1 Tax=Ornithodoros turicata TaxID=34597 RepID=UPI00313A3F6E